MSQVVIKAENISKQYRLGVVGSSALKDDVARFWAKLQGKEDPTLKIGQTNDRTQKADSDYVWALQNINFEVQKGEVLGIIGKNGAGKSTLLKILSKITAPTRGSIKIKGRIASLLEVGTGFHGELTGRENIYLNGAILGMRRHEVTRKLDEIIAFAGVEKYVDTPVKRYSSGMTVRLGFAVAAHLEPEILVVDEVLAVGDAEFQKKAIGKMQDVSTQEGRTILFVSHNMASVQNLCTRGLVMKNGGIDFSGDIRNSVNHYLQHFTAIDASLPLHSRTDRKGNGSVIFYGIEIYVNGKVTKSVCSGDNCRFRIYYQLKNKQIYRNCRIGIAFVKQGINFFLLSTELVCDNSVTIENDGFFEFTVPELPLSIGSYHLTLFMEGNETILDWISDAYQLQVEDGNYYGNGKNYAKGWAGKTVLVKHSFHIHQ